MRRKYTKEILETIAGESISLRDVILKLGLSYSGGNISYIRSLIIKFDIDTSHFLSQGHNKGKVLLGIRKKPEEYLGVYERAAHVQTNTIKKWLFRDGLKEKKCESCGLMDWMRLDIPLELHHVDGNRWNNTIENLQILCPNCHSLTETFAKKNRNNGFVSYKESRNTCVDCGNYVYKNAVRCRPCNNKFRANKKMTE